MALKPYKKKVRSWGNIKNFHKQIPQKECIKLFLGKPENPVSLVQYSSLWSSFLWKFRWKQERKWWNEQPSILTFMIDERIINKDSFNFLEFFQHHHNLLIIHQDISLFQSLFVVSFLNWALRKGKYIKIYHLIQVSKNNYQIIQDFLIKSNSKYPVVLQIVWINDDVVQIY